MYNFRYHLVTIVSIFAALALGLLLGVALTGSDLVRDASSNLAQSLTEQFNELNEENRLLSEQLQREKVFSSQLATGWQKERLEGRTIVILTRAPEEDDALSEELSALITRSGGIPVLIRINETSGFGVDEAKTLSELKKILPEIPQEDYSVTLARALAREWSFVYQPSGDNGAAGEDASEASTASGTESGNETGTENGTETGTETGTGNGTSHAATQNPTKVSTAEMTRILEKNFVLTELLIKSGNIEITVSYRPLLDVLYELDSQPGSSEGSSGLSLGVLQRTAYECAQDLVLPYGANGIIDTAIYVRPGGQSIRVDTTALQIAQQFEQLGQAGELPYMSFEADEFIILDETQSNTLDRTLNYFSLMVQDSQYVEPLLTVAQDNNVSSVLSSPSEYRDYSVIALLTGALKGSYGPGITGARSFPLIPADTRGNAPFIGGTN